MIVETINPRTAVRSHIDLPVSDTVMSAARVDLSASEFVQDLARERLPAGFMLLGGELKTP